MLFVDGWFSINVDPLICGNEKQSCVIMRINSVTSKQINQGANQTEDSRTKITQKAFCITKIEFLGIKNYRNE
jgi:hypothetical protein